MQLGGGIGIYKDSWEYIDSLYEDLIMRRQNLITIILNNRIGVDFRNKTVVKEVAIRSDDILKELKNERNRMRVRVCDIERPNVDVTEDKEYEEFYRMFEDFINKCIERKEKENDDIK